MNEKTMEDTKLIKNANLIKEWRKSPTKFVKDLWGLSSQDRKEPFIKGKHISWQQVEILQAVEKAINGQESQRISVRSGHGIGKSCVLSWLIIWFLLCFKDSQIPCTAPTSTQMHDVLWKELSKWIHKLPELQIDKQIIKLADKFDWTASYLRITESPETWFARAKTARKEAPEALAGMHGERVMFIIDEASGVPEEIFNTAEGALTEKNILVIMISNPTRTTGYFYQSHTSDKDNWQTLAFSGEDSPLVEDGYIKRIANKHGIDSDEYRIRVKGEFPNMEAMDDKGFIPLFNENEIHLEPISEFIGEIRMGVDPSGEGTDKTAWVGRDNYKAKIFGMEAISNPKSVATGTMTWMTEHNIKEWNVMVDSFGIGGDVGKELALSDNHYNVGTVNVGENKWEYQEIDNIYLNLRALAYFRIKTWFRQGGSIMDTQEGRELKKELLNIKYKRNLRGQIQIMSKIEMKKQSIPSPNLADALMLTFINDIEQINYDEQQRIEDNHNSKQVRGFDYA